MVNYLQNKTLPIEAVEINGEYIENIIEGYKTLYTKGRESLAIQLDTYTVGNTHGERIRSKKYPARTITVGFIMGADSVESLRVKFTILNDILASDKSVFVFRDEADKFYTGIPIMNATVEDRQSTVTGEWQIYCGDPFKYSIVPQIQKPTIINEHSAEFIFDYNATMPVAPLLRAEFVGKLEGGNYSQDGDCGFIAFTDKDSNIIQLGNPDAHNADAFSKAKQIVNRVFTTLDGWVQSGGINYNGNISPGQINIGEINDPYWNNGEGKKFPIISAEYGTGLKLHGPVIRYPENPSDETGAVNYQIYLVHKMNVSSIEEKGSFEILSTKYDQAKNQREIISGICIDKPGNGTRGTVKYIINGKVVGRETIDLSYYNDNLGYCNKTPAYKTYYQTKTVKVKGKKKKKKKKKTRSATRTRQKLVTVQKGYTYTQSNLNTFMEKNEGVYTFKVGNLPTRKYNAFDTKNTEANEINLYFGKYEGSPQLNTNSVSSVKFLRNQSKSFSEIPNVFTSGDIVEADCSDASIYIMQKGTEDGHLHPEYGAFGNDWEDFTIDKGNNQIKAVWSDWVDPEYKPELSIIYNEVFI